MQESSVTLDIDQFWSLISDSQLLNADQIDVVRAKWTGDDTVQIAETLVAEKVISPLHRDVLLAGHGGPFVFGRYLVVAKIAPPTQSDLLIPFAGRDLRTQHPVMLNFFKSTKSSAVNDWKRIEARVRKLAKCRHEHLLETFQTISLPDYRFVVTELPAGVRLSEKLPPRGRLKLAQAAPIVRQIARAAQSQIDAGIDVPLPTAEQLMESIWLGANGTAKLQPPWIKQQHTKSVEPAKALAALLLRMTGGAWPKPDNVEQLIEKSAIAGDLKAFVQKAFVKAPEEPLDPKKLLTALKNIAPKIPKPTPLPSLPAFRQMLSSSQLFTAPVMAPVQTVPTISANVQTAALENSDDPRIVAARKAADARRNARWKMPVAIATTLLSLLAIGGIWALTANQKVITRVVENADSRSGSSVDFSATPANDDRNNLPDTEVITPDFSNVAYVQEILDDDSTRLWESPTTGKPIDFRYVPSTTEILLQVRPYDLAKSDEGQRLLRTVSTTFEQPLKTLRDSVGIPLNQMQTLTVALYPGNSGSYQIIYRVTAINDLSIDNLKMAWGKPDEIRTKDGNQIYATEERAYLIIASDSPNAISFVSGEPKPVQKLAMRDGKSILARPLQRLVNRTDRERHVNFLTSPKALTDRFGRKLWGDLSSTIVARLRVFFPDEMDAFSVHLHVDDGDYIELHVDHSPDTTAKQFRQELESKINGAVNDFGDFAAALPKLGYWNNVRQRIPMMTKRFSRALRWDVEFGNVIANAWLPPDAAQNLIAASELTLAFANTVSPTQIADTKQTPQTMEELLASKRSLNIANPPDLNILLSNLAADINDDFPNMPFRFKITLLGNDLQKEGITQNQRPGPLAFDDMELAEILTSIMVSANPDKDILGPADPNCKLVWVVVDNRGTNNKMVAVTTRAASTVRGEKLPAAFATP